MAEHPNVTTVRNAIGAMNSGDMQAMADGLADDVVWHEIGNPNPVRSKAALAERWSSGGMGDIEFSSSAHDVVGNDDHVVGLAETTVRRGDKSLSYRTAEIFHVKDGKITERWAFSDDTAAIIDFFS